MLRGTRPRLHPENGDEGEQVGPNPKAALQLASLRQNVLLLIISAAALSFAFFLGTSLDAKKKVQKIITFAKHV